ncbi:MAG TPA: hypothetical protein PLG27_00935 [Candidatus Latescibacteria bacterium]|nr:hypothetical protein [Candidatus Latescibacterota bacterium]HOF61843.1 hypothetical protein [Candidatus Latescibacterota bacterium]HOM56297.1 hypothetical protein [Candidatus Latescibacterota bacterium]HOS65323.1 hypothetical protein [Candidatus Latescibacterota bacterium]HOT36875.1 hypothetical protein [Candidatus Latescibacterota bacterium]
MRASWTETPQARNRTAAIVSFGLHGLLAAAAAFFAITAATPPPEFVELNVGRLSQAELNRLIQEGERASAAASPEERAQTPQQRLPDIEMPTISPTEAERRLMPTQVALKENKVFVAPPRPTAIAAPPIPVQSIDRKVRYEGGQISLGPRPGEGIVSEHVGSDIHPVFQIEGDLIGRRFYEAAITETPNVPAQTRIQFDLVVSPSGAVISALVVRRENSDLEAFAANYLRRCRFDPLPAGMPQENQTGRITITFSAG